MFRSKKAGLFNIIIFILLIVLISFLIYINLGKFTRLVNGDKEVFVGDTVFINESVLVELRSALDFDGDEWVFCLDTLIVGDKLVVVGVERVETIFSTHERVISGDDCKDSDGTVHNHLVGVCKPSPQDLYSYGLIDSVGDTKVHLIMCGSNDFFVFPVPRGNRSIDMVGLGWDSVVVS